MADNDIFAAGVGQHGGGNFTGVSAGGVGVAVFSADADSGLAHGADGSGDANGRHAQGDIAPATLGHDRLELGHEFLRLGRRLVHFPVAGNDSLTVLSVHDETLLYISVQNRFKFPTNHKYAHG